jgi:MFS family permease
MDFFSPKNIGKAQGVFIALSSSTSIIAPLVFGYLIQYATTEAIGYQYAFQATSFVMFVIGLLFWVGVRPVKKKHTTITSEDQVIV